MKQAIIDIGSNSIRLTLYETQQQSFKILFREKIMAGLAGYVEDGRLSAEGIECACAGLLTFRGILQTLQIDSVRVFATASLRNISNTQQALSVIRAATGYAVEVISGEDEALYGYTGAMQELDTFMHQSPHVPAEPIRSPATLRRKLEQLASTLSGVWEKLK